MAEAVGIASAALTFADVGVKLLGTSFELALRIKDAPKELQDIKETLELLAQLFRRIGSTTASSQQRHDPLFNGIIARANNQINFLDSHVFNLLPLAGDSTLKEVQKSFKHILKTDKLRNVKENLESVKVDLLLYLENHERYLRKTMLLFDGLYLAATVLYAQC